MSLNQRALIEDFLALNRIAFVGLSRDEKSFSRTLDRELVERGYDVVPVNPSVDEIDGRRCYPDVRAIEPAVDGAIIMLDPEATRNALTDCADARIDRVWVHRGCISKAGSFVAKSRGMLAVTDECMFMFLPGTGFVHRIHRTIDRLTGRYPI